MFESLYIKNLALVTELELNFTKGFTVVTGETGAGKSLIFGAFRLLLGGRADKSMIRREAKSCEIAAQFVLDDVEPQRREEIEQLLKEAGIEEQEEQALLIRRVITATGTRCYINGCAIPVNLLKQLGDLLVDIHGPNEQQTLFQSSVQLKFLDEYLGKNSLLLQVQDLWKAIQQKKQELQNIQQQGLSESELDYIRFQLQEIDKANLEEDEEERVNARYKLLSSGKRLLELVDGVAQGLSGDGENSISDQLTALMGGLNELAHLDPQQGEEFVQRLENSIEAVRDLSNDLLHYGGQIEIDAEELRFLDARMEVIFKIKRRYGGSIQAALAQAEQWRQQIDIAENLEDKTAALQHDLKKLETEFQQVAEKLTAERKLAAKKLSAGIIQKMHALGFLQASFEIELKTVAPHSKGVDQIEFCFAPNPGEGMQPLRKIGSSGELARVMLAIKTVLGHTDHIPVLIFDEIDANIGGRVALDVAKEIKKLGQWHQVFVISHLAQIAAAGDSHYLVKKSVEGARTLTHIILLEDKERNLELMRMMGADETSENALKHVCEIRESVNKI